MLPELLLIEWFLERVLGTALPSLIAERSIWRDEKIGVCFRVGGIFFFLFICPAHVLDLCMS